MTTSSLEGLVGIDNDNTTRSGWWAPVSAPLGNSSLYIPDPAVTDGIYPNSIHLSWGGQDDGANWGFYFWTDRSYTHGSFFRVRTADSSKVIVSKELLTGLPIYDGRTQIIIGNVINGAEVVVIQRFIDTFPGIPGSAGVVDVASSESGRAVFSVSKSQGGYVTSFFGPRFFTAFSFSSPQFNALPLSLTRMSDRWQDLRSPMKVASVVHDLGQHTLLIPESTSSWVINDTANLFEGSGVKKSLRKPAGTERQEVEVSYLASSAGTVPVPRQREAVEVASVGAYAQAGARTMPWASPGSTPTTATMKIELDVPAGNFFSDDFQGWPLTRSLISGINGLVLSGGINVQGATNLGTRLTLNRASVITSALLDGAPFWVRGGTTYTAEPNPQPNSFVFITGFDGGPIAYRNLPEYDALTETQKQRFSGAASWDNYRNQQAAIISSFESVISDWNSGLALVLPSNIQLYSADWMWVENFNVYRLANRRTVWNAELFGFCDLTPRLVATAAPEPSPNDFSRSTSEAVRVGGVSQNRISISGVNGIYQNNVGSYGVVYDRTQLRNKVRLAAFGSNPPYGGEGVAVYADGSWFRGAEQADVPNLTSVNISFRVDGPPLSAVRNLFSGGTATFSATCSIKYETIFFKGFLQDAELPATVTVTVP